MDPNQNCPDRHRYALLAGATYYPAPGWRGFQEWHDDLDKAQARGKELAAEYCGWFQVLNVETFEIVAGEGAGHTGLFGKVSAA